MCSFNEHQFDVVHDKNSSPKNRAENSIKRKMIILIKAMAGKTLLAFKHGKHLKNGVVCDEMLRLKNFNHAENTGADLS